MGKTAGSILLLFLCTILFFWKIIFTGEYTLLGQYDNSMQFYPWYQYAAYALRQGFLPLWDPYTSAGHTFIGEMQPGLFYPLNLLMFLFPENKRGELPVLVIEGFIILGHFLAGCFMFALARRLGLSRFASVVSGVCFGLNGFVGTRALSQINVFHSAIWIPLVFLMFIDSLSAPQTKRKIFYAMAAGLFLGMSILAGHHQAAIYTVAALAIFCLFLLFSRRRGDEVSALPPASAAQLVLSMAVCLIFAFALSAIQLLPTVEYVQHAIRWVGPEIRPGRKIPYHVLGFQNLQPRDLFALLFPQVAYSGDGNPYFGIFPLFLVSYALFHIRSQRYIRFFTMLGAVALIYAFGYFSLLHGVTYALVPFLDKARESIRTLYIFHFSMAVLAGFGVDLLTKAVKKSVRHKYERFVRGANVFGLGIVCLVLGGYLIKVWALKKEDYDDNLIFLSASFVAASIFLLNARRYHLLSRTWFKTGALALLLFDFSYFHTMGFHVKNQYDGKNNLNPKEHYKINDTIRFIASQPGLYRVDIREETLPPAMGDVHRIQTTFGYGASAYADYWDFIWSGYSPPGKPLDLLNVKFIISKQDIGGLELVKDGAIKVYQNPHCLPRAWIVHQVEIVPGGEAVRARINQASFDPRKVALIGEPLSAPLLPGENTGGQCDVTVFTPNYISLQCETGSSGLLVLSEIDYPGWEARVDGKRTKIYRTNGILRGVVLEQGRHKVEFRYRPLSFRLGLLCSGFALLALGSCAFISFRGKEESGLGRDAR